MNARIAVRREVKRMELEYMPNTPFKMEKYENTNKLMRMFHKLTKNNKQRIYLLMQNMIDEQKEDSENE